MWKIQLFVFVEALLLTMAAITILAGNISRIVLIVVLCLLLLYYYIGKQRSNFLLVASSILLFFIVMLNPYVIAALLFAVVYAMLVAYPYFYRENEEVKIDYEENVEIRQEKTPWIGDLHHFSKVNCHFRDLTITRLFGKDTIHLDEVIVVNHDNVIIMRKMFGNTKIILPVDVELSLQVNTLYGELRLFSQKPRKLRNETVSMETPNYRSSHRTVKLVIAGIVGDVEVVRG